MSVFQPKLSPTDASKNIGFLDLTHKDLTNAVGEKKLFEEQFWHMGKLLGTVRGIFSLSNLPVMQQMTIGVLGVADK